MISCAPSARTSARMLSTGVKSSELAQGNAVYVMRIDPGVPGEEYDITRLIAEVFPVEVQNSSSSTRKRLQAGASRN